LEKLQKLKVGGTALAWIPVGVAVFLGGLLLPRATPPEDIPLPNVDGRALARTEAQDHRLAELARTQLLSPEVRELGSAVREFNSREARDAEGVAMNNARITLGQLLEPALAGGVEALLRLRAVQLEAFLTEARSYEATGEASKELDALGGTFVRRMTQVGWCADHKVLLSDAERRVAFKMAWNGVAGVASRPEFAVSLDETRTLYTFFLSHPHAAEAAKARLDGARKNAKDKATCDALEAGENVAAEAWRLDKINKLGAIDSAYPLAYAQGVAQFRLGHFEESVEAFEAWIKAHPDGAYTLRARNHLRAALEAEHSSI
jgi:TolA-binding protein